MQPASPDTDKSLADPQLPAAEPPAATQPAAPDNNTTAEEPPRQPPSLRQRALLRTLLEVVPSGEIQRRNLERRVGLPHAALAFIEGPKAHLSNDIYRTLANAIERETNEQSAKKNNFTTAVAALVEHQDERCWLAVQGGDEGADRSAQRVALAQEILDAKAVVMAWPRMAPFFLLEDEMHIFDHKDLPHVDIFVGAPALADEKTCGRIKEMVQKRARVSVMPTEFLASNCDIDTAIAVITTADDRKLVYTDSIVAGLFLETPEDTDPAIAHMDELVVHQREGEFDVLTLL